MIFENIGKSWRLICTSASKLMDECPLTHIEKICEENFKNFKDQV